MITFNRSEMRFLQTLASVLVFLYSCPHEWLLRLETRTRSFRVQRVLLFLWLWVDVTVVKGSGSATFEGKTQTRNITVCEEVVNVAERVCTSYHI